MLRFAEVLMRCFRCTQCSNENEGGVERAVGEVGKGRELVVVGIESSELGDGHGEGKARLVLYVRFRRCCHAHCALY